MELEPKVLPMSEDQLKKSDFQKWIDKRDAADTEPFPLTHIARSLFARKILDDGQVDTRPCKNFDEKPLAYFFYGRPAYRANQDQTVSLEASCPCCFIFDPKILKRAHKVHAFDTGAFFARMYQHVLDDGFSVSAFEVGRDPDRVMRLVSATFNSNRGYFDADRSDLIAVEDGAEAWELEAKSYLSLLHSPGRNEPDDRICTIEITFSDPVLLEDDLKAVVVPHTFWSNDVQAPFLKKYDDAGVEIITYRFIPGRTPEYYQTHIEAEILNKYREWGFVI